MKNSSKQSVKMDMLHGSLFDKMLMFAMPLAACSILQQLFNSVGTAVVGRFASSEALAAVGSNSSVIALMVTLFSGISLGSNVVIANYIGQNDSEAFAVKYDKEVYQPAIAACHKQSEECYEVPIQQKRDFDINEQRRQTFLQSQKLSRKLQDDWVTLEKGQYPLTMKVSEINSKSRDFDEN